MKLDTVPEHTPWQRGYQIHRQRWQAVQLTQHLLPSWNIGSHFPVHLQHLFKQSKFSDHVAESISVWPTQSWTSSEGGRVGKKREGNQGRTQSLIIPTDLPPLRDPWSNTTWLWVYVASTQNCAGYDTIFRKTSPWTSRRNSTFKFEGIHPARVSRPKLVSLRDTNYVWNTNVVQPPNTPNRYYHKQWWAASMHLHSFLEFFLESSGLCQLDLNVHVGRCLQRIKLELQDDWAIQHLKLL